MMSTSHKIRSVNVINVGGETQPPPSRKPVTRGEQREPIVTAFSNESVFKICSIVCQHTGEHTTMPL